MLRLQERIHFGWVGATAAAMTIAYLASGPASLGAANTATDIPAPVIPVVTQPPRPIIPALPTIADPKPNVPTLDAGDIEDQVEDAVEQVEDAREEAEEQAEDQREASEEAAEDARRDAEQARRDAEREGAKRRAEAEASDPR